MVIGPIDVAESTLFRLAKALPETRNVVGVAFLPPPHKFGCAQITNKERKEDVETSTGRTRSSCEGNPLMSTARRPQVSYHTSSLVFARPLAV